MTFTHTMRELKPNPKNMNNHKTRQPFRVIIWSSAPDLVHTIINPEGSWTLPPQHQTCPNKPDVNIMQVGLPSWGSALPAPRSKDTRVRCTYHVAGRHACLNRACPNRHDDAEEKALRWGVAWFDNLECTREMEQVNGIHGRVDLNLSYHQTVVSQLIGEHRTRLQQVVDNMLRYAALGSGVYGPAYATIAKEAGIATDEAMRVCAAIQRYGGTTSKRYGTGYPDHVPSQLLCTHLERA